MLLNEWIVLKANAPSLLTSYLFSRVNIYYSKGYISLKAYYSGADGVVGAELPSGSSLLLKVMVALLDIVESYHFF